MSLEPFTLSTLLLKDPARLAALDAYHVLDTPAEQSFDDVVRLATRLCDVPVALVSLVTRERQWFKARIGFPRCETDLDSSVCKFVLPEPDLLVIPDLTADPRTAANPLVTDEPHIRFYAGAPLRTPEGHVLGSLCAIDTEPRPAGLTPEQADDLRALARQVESLLSMRRAVEHRDVVLDRQRGELSQARRLDVLAKASAALVTATDPAAVLNPILSASAEVLGFDRSYTYDLWPGGRSLRLTHFFNTTIEVQDYLRHMPFGAPLCGIVAERRQPLVVTDLQSSDDALHQNARGIGLNAYAGFPLMSRGALRGVISFASTQQPVFDAETLAFFETVSRLMSAVYDRLDGEAALRISEARAHRAQEAGRVGTFELEVESGLIALTPEFCRLFGMPASPFYSVEAITAHILPEDLHVAFKAEALADKNLSRSTEYRIRRADDGELRWIARETQPVLDDTGQIVRWFGTVRDITARKQAEADLRHSEAIARENIQRVQLALDAGAIIGTWFWDIPSDRFTVDEAFARTFGLDPALGREGIPLAQIVATVHPDDQAGLSNAINEAIACGGPYAHQYRVQRDDGHYYWIEANGRVDHAPDGTPQSFPGVLLDVGERRAAQERQDILNHELSHRLKNTLSIVSSIAHQTLRAIPDQEPIEAFERRIQALACAHDTLLRGKWTAAPLRVLCEDVLRAVAHVERFSLNGPDVALGPTSAMSVSLIMHELATNAVKYGALSTQTGRVAVTWEIEAGTVGLGLSLRWCERGGPAVVAPTHRGFGSRLIRTGLVGTGGVEMVYRPEGFEATMRASLVEVQGA